MKQRRIVYGDLYAGRADLDACPTSWRIRTEGGLILKPANLLAAAALIQKWNQPFRAADIHPVGFAEGRQ
jgi:hypothetical protein